MAGKNFIQRGVAELMVARPDSAKSLLIYKHPDPTIPTRAQLTVDADEMAIFFKDGTVVGTVGPGRHTLHSDNIPFLSNLVDSFTGANVLLAEVFFVTTREVPDFKFGGRIGSVEDPKSGVPVETLVHGSFSVRVTNPEKLLIGLVGVQATNANAFIKWFRELLLKTIRDNVAELIVKEKWPLLDVTSGAYTEEVEASVLAGCKQHIDAYGISVIRLGNFVISLKADDETTLKKLYTDAAYVRMAGGLAGFSQFAAGKAMLGAGEGMAAAGGSDAGGAAGAAGGSASGGALLGGAGLGVGFGMASMFQAHAAHASHTAALAPAAPPPVPPSSPSGPGASFGVSPPNPFATSTPPLSFHIILDGAQMGPYGLDVLQQGVASGQFTRATLVWSHGMPGWKPAGEVDALDALFNAAAPPPPPTP